MDVRRPNQRDHVNLSASYILRESDRNIAKYHSRLVAWIVTYAPSTSTPRINRERRDEWLNHFSETLLAARAREKCTTISRFRQMSVRSYRLDNAKGGKLSVSWLFYLENGLLPTLEYLSS